MALNIIALRETDSTNGAAARMEDALTPHGTVVSAFSQTAGRGQRGNKWESEPGANLMFSMVLRPAFPAQRQFELSMAVSVGVARVLAALLPDSGITVKWPNDIYAGNGKMAGILIENTLSGPLVSRAIVGIGINVNQTVFRSNAPNPVSMAQLAGHTFDLDALLDSVCRSVLDAVDSHIVKGDAAALLDEYMSMLWRNDGRCHRWLDTSSLQIFEGAIAAVSPAGPLTLRTPQGTERSYAFKEVAAVL